MTVFAIACHPDDIEFMMSGTLFRLKEAGCGLHYLNIANGSCGTTTLSYEEIVEVRRKEAIAAAGYLGAEYHESLVDDLEVFYNQDLIRRVTSVIRLVAPDILLLPSPEDYMEDHMNTSRVCISAAFYRGMINFASNPPRDPISTDVVLYHALPYGLQDGLRRAIEPDFYVDVSEFIDAKQRMLGFHESQKSWLDSSQGIDSYLVTMRDMTGAMGKMSGQYDFAEGWRRHSHLGYSGTEIDPMGDLLAR